MSRNRIPYKFEHITGELYSYLIETENQVVYQVIFKPTPYLFGQHPDLGEETFELVIDVVFSPTNRMPSDSRMPITIAAICQNFFANKDRILLYICETADARHLARVRKFDTWFREFNDFRFLKIDTNFPDTNGTTYFLSLIFRMGHPHRHTIIDEFELLSRQHNLEK